MFKSDNIAEAGLENRTSVVFSLRRLGYIYELPTKLVSIFLRQ